jgi:hypothetical protein
MGLGDATTRFHWFWQWFSGALAKLGIGFKY